MSTGKIEPSSNWRTIGERTRRQLEELDALLERMLALPPLETTHEPGDPPSPYPEALPPAEHSGSPPKASSPSKLISPAVSAEPTARPLTPWHSQSVGEKVTSVATAPTISQETKSAGDGSQPSAEGNDACTVVPEQSAPSLSKASAPAPKQEPEPTTQSASAPVTSTAKTWLEDKPSPGDSAPTAPAGNQDSMPAANVSEKGPAWLLREEPVGATPSANQAAGQSALAQPSELDQAVPPPEPFSWPNAFRASLSWLGKRCFSSPTVLNWLGWVGILLLLGSAAIWLGVWLSWHW